MKLIPVRIFLSGEAVYPFEVLPCPNFDLVNYGTHSYLSSVTNAPLFACLRLDSKADCTAEKIYSQIGFNIVTS